jgi:oligopeptide/dipeptide ABC transporter ATP-binding protein
MPITAGAQRHEAIDSRGSVRRNVDQPLLELSQLSVEFRTASGFVTAVNDVSYALERGEVAAVVGESGSGKSVSARAVLGLLPSQSASVRGRIFFQGVDLLTISRQQMQRLRGRHIALVPQDPLNALNPVFPVGWQVAEVLRLHLRQSRTQARRAAIELMSRVHIPDAASRFGQYPYQYSGGMRQRALIAMAIALKPSLLIADEPTTALDVTTQAQILSLLLELQAESGMALMLITHDLGVVAEVATRTIVMYAGRVCEMGDTRTLLERPSHAYTLVLRDALPTIDNRLEKLVPIPGTPPDMSDPPPGCAFHPRCRWAVEGVCDSNVPVLTQLGDRSVACHFASQILSTEG